MRREYKLVICHTRYEMDSEVNRFINEGYVPQGGIAMMVIDGTFFYAQAMIRYDNDDTNITSP